MEKDATEDRSLPSTEAQSLYITKRGAREHTGLRLLSLAVFGLGSLLGLLCLGALKGALQGVPHAPQEQGAAEVLEGHQGVAQAQQG